MRASCRRCLRGKERGAKAFVRSASLLLTFAWLARWMVGVLSHATRMPRSIARVSIQNQDSSGVTPASVEILIEGMHCGSCVALVEETLTEHDGVRSASVDLDAGKATIGYDPAVVDVSTLTAAIQEAGYAATTAG